MRKIWRKIKVDKNWIFLVIVEINDAPSSYEND